MPVTGRKPKPEGRKRNRVQPTYEWREVPDVPFEGGPPLPPRRPGGKPWPAFTKDWWADVSRMPHCVLWTETDWRFALETAVLAAQFHATCDLKAEAGLFRRERVLGMTVDARRDLRIRYVPVEAEEADEDASVTTMADYRVMLGG